MSDFKKLLVWKKAHLLALNAHRIARGIRGAEYLSLRSQIIRSAMSISANIVEGRGQESPKEFARYLSIAINSASELEYHLIVGRDVKAIDEQEFETVLDQLIEVRRMLHGLINHVRSRSSAKSDS